MQPPPYLTKNLVYSMLPSAITGVFVAGNRILDTGELLTISEFEITERIKHSTGNSYISTRKSL